MFGVIASADAFEIYLLLTFSYLHQRFWMCPPDEICMSNIFLEILLSEAVKAMETSGIVLVAGVAVLAEEPWRKKGLTVRAFVLYVYIHVFETGNRALALMSCTNSSSNQTYKTSTDKKPTIKVKANTWNNYGFHALSISSHLKQKEHVMKRKSISSDYY
ncbi:hypothetical protein ACS0TY_001704 [Phlomoides rotata]